MPHAEAQAITQFVSNKDFKNASQFSFDSKSPLVVIEILKLTFFHILKEKHVPYEEHQ